MYTLDGRSGIGPSVTAASPPLLKQDRTNWRAGLAAMRIAFFHICGKHRHGKTMGRNDSS
jgi:hypothetical protein